MLLLFCVLISINLFFNANKITFFGILLTFEMSLSVVAFALKGDQVVGDVLPNKTT